MQLNWCLWWDTRYSDIYIDIVGHGCVLSASRMNSAIILFLSTIEKANELVESAVVICGLFVLLLPLSTHAKILLCQMCHLSLKTNN